jgi:ClpP class serine protease
VKVSYISAGKYKTEGNFEEPLTDEARAHIQSIVDDSYGLFVGDVARGRGVSAADVRANYGEGRALTVKDAKAAGMIDRIAGYDETVRRLAGVKAESADYTDHADRVSNQLAGVKAESADYTDDADRVSNSQARIALKRRRLEIAQKTLEEVAK